MNTPEPNLPVAEAVAIFQAERQRQISEEGWTPSHDDAHENGELMRAGMCYLAEAQSIGSYRSDGKPMAWPWEDMWWKPSTPQRDLVKAGALFLAERERLDRAKRYYGHVDHKIRLAARLFSKFLPATPIPDTSAGERSANAELADKINRSYLFTLNKDGPTEKNLTGQEIDLILAALRAPEARVSSEAAFMEGVDRLNGTVSPNPSSAGERMREAAQAVIDRWDTPNWKDAPATAVVINNLRAALDLQGPSGKTGGEG